MSENTGVDMLHSCGWVQHGFKKLLKDQNKEREIESFAKIVVTGERWAIFPLERVFVVRWVLVLAATFGEIRGSLSDPLIVRLLGPFWRLLQSSSQDLGVARFGICGREHNAPAQDKRFEHHKNHFPVWTDEFLASYFSFMCLFWSALQRMQKIYILKKIPKRNDACSRCIMITSTKDCSFKYWQISCFSIFHCSCVS